MREDYLAGAKEQAATRNRFSAFGEVELMVLRKAFHCADNQWFDKSRVDREVFDKLHSQLKAAMREKLASE